MARRTRPSRAFLIRDRHRSWLAIHFFVLLVGSATLLLFNRFVVPGRFWAHWAALGWVGLFLLHFIWFSRATIATMGGHSSAEPRPDSGEGT